MVPKDGYNLNYCDNYFENLFPNLVVKKSPANDEVEDIKRSLDFLAEEVRAIKIQQKHRLVAMEVLKEVKQNEQKDNKITQLKT